MLEKFKEFRPTSWAIDNRTTIYLLTVFITLAGIMAYRAIPKEQFPDIVIPTIYVQTVYPGAAPKDVENLITKPIEKQIKSIAGVKKVTSQSLENVSVIMGLVASALEFKAPRNRVVYSEMQFPTVMYAWEAQRRHGAEIVQVRSRDGVGVATEDFLAYTFTKTYRTPKA